MFWTISYFIFEVLIALFALIGNIYVIILFLYDPRLKINRNFYLISLAFANILTSLLEIPCTILPFFNLPYDNNTICYFGLSAICLARTIKNYAIAAIALDRLKAVTHPFEYRTNNSTVSSLIIIGICWLIAMMIGVLTMVWEVDGSNCNIGKIDPLHIQLCHAVGKLLPYTIVVVCHVFIFRSIWRRRAIKKINGNGSETKSKADLREIRATIRITWIIGILTMCEIPLNITEYVMTFGYYVSKATHYTLLVVAHSHVAINPFIYALNLSDFKKASQKFLNRDNSS